MFTPGALTSGFWALSPRRGPPDEKSALLRYAPLVMLGPALRVAPMPSEPWRVSLAPRPMPTIGMSKIDGV